MPATVGGNGTSETIYQTFATLRIVTQILIKSL